MTVIISYVTFVILAPIIKSNIHKEQRFEYNNPEYVYVGIKIKNISIKNEYYYGVITNEQYLEWLKHNLKDSDNLWVYSIIHPNRKYIVNIYEIEKMQIISKDKFFSTIAALW